MKMLNGAEDAARVAMVNMEPRDPLPPGPNYGPFGYFRLAVLLLAAFAGILFVINLF
ncbi:hypothetical protein [Chelativorans sp. AA-79]|uniref:hypothetical protein n=1 Tax=Chelativorans sp. AA-79 TaxID=3028735 RepID=UPI0023F82B53|nr:hypothetical protein [Chelativorans sp. AA-79]WEX10036.1 hypothetical protein PVE73_03455 [Chelativorans sp. AA-79]